MESPRFVMCILASLVLAWCGDLLADDLVVVGVSDQVQAEIARAQLAGFLGEQGNPGPNTSRVVRLPVFGDLRTFGRLKMPIALSNSSPDTAAEKALGWKPQTGGKERRYFPVGTAAVAVVVHPANHVSGLLPDDLRKLLAAGDSRANWKSVGETGGFVNCYIENSKPACQEVIRRRCMTFQNERRGGWYLYRQDLQALDGRRGVIDRVRKDRDGLGIVVFDGTPIEGVRVVPIRREAGGPTLNPSEAGYPLALELGYFLRPGASAIARQFCEFAVGEQGSRIASEHGLVTPYMKAQAEIAKRLEEWSRGVGEGVTALGDDKLAACLREGNIDYVQAIGLIRVNYVSTSETAAIGSFLQGRELAFIEGGLSERTRQIHGKRLKALNPQKLSVGGRGVALLVNRANRLQSLSLGQLQGVFGGEVEDWRLLRGLDAEQTINTYAVKDRRPGRGGSAGSLPRGGVRRGVGGDAGAKSDGDSGELPSDSTSNAIFYESVLEARKCRGLERKGTVAEAVNAVAGDPYGIAFVDAASLQLYLDQLREAHERTQRAAAKEGKQTNQTDPPEVFVAPVKVLAIGPPGAAVEPNRLTISEGTYPLSRELTIYVSPKASKEAKSFANFVAGDERCHDTLMAYGILPSYSAEQRSKVAAEMRAAAAKRAELARRLKDGPINDDFTKDAGHWSTTAGFQRIDPGQRGAGPGDHGADAGVEGGADDPFGIALECRPGEKRATSLNCQPLPGAFDLTMDIQVTPGEGPKSGFFGVYFNLPKPADDFYAKRGYRVVWFEPTRGRPELRLVRAQDHWRGRNTVLASKVVEWDQRPVHVRVTSDGAGKIQVYWGDANQPTLEATDPRPLGGEKTYLGVSAGGGMQMARVDNVRVTVAEPEKVDRVPMPPATAAVPRPQESADPSANDQATTSKSPAHTRPPTPGAKGESAKPPAKQGQKQEEEEPAGVGFFD